MLRAVTGVNWRILGGSLVGEYEDEYEEEFEGLTNLDIISDQYGSDEDRLKRVAEEFLASEDPSWRKVIWALYKSNAIHLAERIRSYAEPLEGVLELVLYSVITKPWRSPGGNGLIVCVMRLVLLATSIPNFCFCFFFFYFWATVYAYPACKEKVLSVILFT